MGKRLSFTEVLDDLVVDLWGSEYRMRTISRTVGEQLDKAVKHAQNMANDAPQDEQVAAIVALIDVLLEPTGDAKPAGKLLTARWEADELGLDWLMAFGESLQEEVGARRRPTSATKSAS